jgi:hypothetical protein
MHQLMLALRQSLVSMANMSSLLKALAMSKDLIPPKNVLPKVTEVNVASVLPAL